MFTVLGYGEQGRAIVSYLLAHTKEKIKTLDFISPVVPDKHKDRWEHMPNTLHQWLTRNAPPDKKKNVVISCLPAELNPKIASTCVQHGWDMIDLGGVTEETDRLEKLVETAKRTGSTLVPDCGIAPGLVAAFAGLFKDHYSVKIMCGGLPRVPKLPLGYMRTFCEDGVIKEYSGLARLRRDGVLNRIPTLSEHEYVFIPGLGVMEADVTSGGTGKAAEQLPLANFEYKTLRYPGHWDYVKNHVLSQPDPSHVLRGLLKDSRPSKDNPDLIVFRISRRRSAEDDPITDTYFWEYDSDENVSAMSQATGYTVAAVAAMVHEDMISRSGIVGMHEIDALLLKKRIEKFPNQFKTKLGDVS